METFLEYLTVAGYIVLCLMFFSLAIAIHEWGHFIVALKLGLKVETFSIGFGPAIWKKVINGVEYRLSWIPLGGYVSIPDVDPEGTKQLEGAAKDDGGKEEEREPIPVWKELAVSVAGPLMNFVLAVIIAVALSLIPSAKFGVLPAEIGGTLPGGAADAAGLKVGDVVEKIGESEIKTWTDLKMELQFVGTKTVDFKVRRPGVVEPLTLAVTPREDELTGAAIIQAFSVTNVTKAADWMPCRSVWGQLGNDAGWIFRALKGLVTPKEMKRTGKSLGGPIMIAESIYASTRRDFFDGLGFLRFLNVNLGIMNLLPIPVLDGGIILFGLIALVCRRRVPQKVVGVITTGFMYLLLGLMAVLILHDVYRSWKIHTFDPDKDKSVLMETLNGNEKPDPQP